MVKKSSFQWFNEKILVLLIAIHIQNVTSFWGEENFCEEKLSRRKFFEKKGLPTNTSTARLHAVHMNTELHNRILNDLYY